MTKTVFSASPKEAASEIEKIKKHVHSKRVTAWVMGVWRYVIDVRYNEHAHNIEVLTNSVEGWKPAIEFTYYDNE